MLYIFRERNTAVGGESEVPKKRRGRNKKTEIRASSTESDSLTEVSLSWSYAHHQLNQTR